MTDSKTKWYTVKVHNNHEQKVCDRIVLEMDRLKKDIKVLIPKERIFYAKDGKKKFKEKMIYPGYIFVETDYIGDLTAIVRETTGATNILKKKEDGSPITLRHSEVIKLLKGEEEIKAPVSDELYIVGETIKILSGAFETFNGKVDNIDFENKKIKVHVSIFGRQTPVELDFDQVTKL